MNYEKALIGAAVALKSEGTPNYLFPLPFQEELKRKDIKWSTVQEVYDQYLLICFAHAAINQSVDQIKTLGLSDREVETALILRELCSLPGADDPLNTPLQIEQNKE